MSAEVEHNSPSDDEIQRVGDIVELVHMMGEALVQDEAYRSIVNMSLACKLYEADYRPCLKAKRDTYREAAEGEVEGMTPAQLQLVE